MPRWTEEARTKHREAIKRWKPWEQSTGPVTECGKARVAKNAYKGGKRSKLRVIKSKLREIFKELENSPQPTGYFLHRLPSARGPDYREYEWAR